VQKRNPPLSRAFLRGLRSVSEGGTPDHIPITKLSDFGKRLDHWSANCTIELKKELQSLPKDHPLHCPIGLFGPMGLGRLEVAHTRTLCWLLNPKAEHGFKNELLKAFLSKVDGHPAMPRSISCVDAERFYRNSDENDCGRTDIWIEGKWNGRKQWLTVIEAKVDASEGERQLDRYDKQIKPRRDSGWEIQKIFLTPKGIQPQGENDHWKTLSFGNLARAFLTRVSELRDKPGYDVFRLYVAGIFRDILGLRQNPYSLLAFLKNAEPVKPKKVSKVTYIEQSFGFYVKHWYTMQELCEDKNISEGVTPGMREMAGNVYDSACDQAAKLLGKCGEEVQQHFNRVNGTKAIQRSLTDSLKKYWQIELRLRPKYARKSKRLQWMTGVTVFADGDNAPSLYLWVWARGQHRRGLRQVAEELRELFRGRAKWSFPPAEWDVKAVPFHKIPLHVGDGYVIEEKELLRKLRVGLDAISRKVVEGLFEI
jgi:PD-(D/E)XK nuclease superfamily